MATMEALLRNEEAQVVVKKGRQRQVVRDGPLSAAIRRAYALTRRVRAVEEELSQARQLIHRRAGEFLGTSGTVSFEASGVTCKVTARYEAVIPEDKLAEVRRLLGRRFRDLVRVKTRYLATRQLLEEAAERGEFRELITLRELSPQLTWGVTDPSFLEPTDPLCSGITDSSSAPVSEPIPLKREQAAARTGCASREKTQRAPGTS